jgi:capsular polysaccharide biosynthesis protein
LTDEEILVHIRASMIMLNTYYDIMGSAEILEIASKEAGKERVENLIYELADATSESRKIIVYCKAEMSLARARNHDSIKEVN